MEPEYLLIGIVHTARFTAPICIGQENVIEDPPCPLFYPEQLHTNQGQEPSLHRPAANRSLETSEMKKAVRPAQS